MRKLKFNSLYTDADARSIDGHIEMAKTRMRQQDKQEKMSLSRSIRLYGDKGQLIQQTWKISGCKNALK